MAENETSSNPIESSAKTESTRVEESFGEQYSTLLKSSSVLGTHFRFNIEKQWSDSNDVDIPSYFVLNMKSLAMNLSKIPFFERQKIIRFPSESCLGTRTSTILKYSRHGKNSIASCLEREDIVKNLESLNLAQNSNGDLSYNSSNNCSDNVAPISTSNPSSNVLNENASLDDWLDSVLDD